jgi:hypothetical protein
MFSRDAWVFMEIVLAGALLLLVIVHRTPVGELVRERIPDRPRRRLFLASVSFFLTFASVRGMVYCITHNIPPFHFIFVEGRHIHHLVFGILILLLVGYGWLCDFGTGAEGSSLLASRMMSILYGVGAALTLDEFALWLNLRDVYWSKEGRSSIDAVILFGALLAIGAWGAPLFTKRGASKAGQRS